MEATPFDIAIGLDRSDKTADLHLIQVKDAQAEHQRIETHPEALQDWVTELQTKYPGQRVAICVEQPANNLIVFLQTFEFITLYAINPITLQKFREAFVTSRAKSDAQDAFYLAKLLVTHHATLKAWAPDDAATRRLQRLVTDRRAVVDHRTLLTNRLKSLLKDYFPQALELAGEDLWRPLACAFFLKWPTLQRLQKARPATIRQFYYEHGSRSQSLIEKRLALIAKAVPLTQDGHLLQSFCLRVELIVRQLQLVTEAIAQFDRLIAQAFAEHPDREIFASFPGAGPTLGPRLLAAVGSQRDRYASANRLQCFSGIAPVLKQSGKSHRVQRRYRCPKFLRQSFHEYAGESIRHSTWARAYYAQQKVRGHKHHTIVRALAYKWIRIIYRCWQNHERYDEERYIRALKENGSPLAAACQTL